MDKFDNVLHLKKNSARWNSRKSLLYDVVTYKSNSFHTAKKDISLLYRNICLIYSITICEWEDAKSAASIYIAKFYSNGVECGS